MKKNANDFSDFDYFSIDRVPYYGVSYRYDLGDAYQRVNRMIEAVGYRLREIANGEMEEVVVTEYHFYMGLFGDLRILKEQLDSIIDKEDKDK